MNSFVLDSSVAVAWCFEDEGAAEADQVLDRLASAQAVVPVIWPAEIANALLAGERRKRIRAAEVRRSLVLLRSLNIRIDSGDPFLDAEDWVASARSQRISVYDSAYLCLAIRSNLPLATLDQALAGAARRLNVRLL